MELYAVDGAIPADVLEQFVEELRRNPSHPGRHIAATCERKSLSISVAAAQLGVECADLIPVAEGRASVTPDLALRLEAAGWFDAEFWLRMQSAYDLAQARRRRERTGSDSTPATRTEDLVAVAG